MLVYPKIKNHGFYYRLFEFKNKILYKSKYYLLFINLNEWHLKTLYDIKKLKRWFMFLYFHHKMMYA